VTMEAVPIGVTMAIIIGSRSVAGIAMIAIMGESTKGAISRCPCNTRQRQYYRALETA
jgi:hypothetical protein